MSHPIFGETVSIVNPLKDALERAGALCSSDAEILMRERYETTYGICDHFNNTVDRPLALIAMQWPEDTCSGSTLYERLSQYTIYGIQKHFGLSVTEFLDLPSDIVLYLLELGSKEQKKEGAIAEDLLTQFRK